jgi:ribosomal protein L16 Arg81 hydroxylase
MDFDTLLRPFEVALFRRDYWEKLPCTVSRRRPDYYSQLFSIADLDSLITLTSHTSSPNKIRLVKTHQNKIVTKAIPITADGIANLYSVYRSYYDEGYTITIDRLELRWKPISALCKNLENTLHHPTAANLYFTPLNAQGFLPHFDTHDVFILQLEGSKTWRIYDSPILLPLGDTTSDVPVDSLGPPTKTITLDAGDLLYLPRGFVHDALTSDQPSMHLTLGVHVFRWADLIAEAVVSVSRCDARFRKALPLGFLDDCNSAVLGEELRQLLELLVVEAQSDRAITRIGQRLLSTGQPLPDGHFVTLGHLATVNLSTEVKQRASMIGRILVDDDSVSIHFAGNIVTGPVAIEPALRFIAASELFRVRDLPNCLDDEDKLVLVSRLVREGFLTITA